MHRIIAGGTGLIGKRLAEHWLKQKHTITIVGRTEGQIRKVFGQRVFAVTWDQLTAEILQSAELVVNLAGAGIANEPWIDTRKQEIIDSRVKPTKKINDLLVELGDKAPLLLNASAIGIYGLQTQLADRLPVNLDENTSFDWDNPPDFLSQVGRQWELAAEPAVLAGCRIIFLRFGVVLAKEGGALPPIMKPFRYYVGGSLGSGKQPFCWVAIDDVIRAIDFLIAKPDTSGPFNIVAPECVFQKNFADTLAKVMGRPAFMRTPGFVLKYLLGIELARELLLEGQHIYPQRLLDMGFRFAYPDLESALNHILK